MVLDKNAVPSEFFHDWQKITG